MRAEQTKHTIKSSVLTLLSFSNKRLTWNRSTWSGLSGSVIFEARHWHNALFSSPVEELATANRAHSVGLTCELKRLVSLLGFPFLVLLEESNEDPFG